MEWTTCRSPNFFWKNKLRIVLFAHILVILVPEKLELNLFTQKPVFQLILTQNTFGIIINLSMASKKPKYRPKNQNQPEIKKSN
jgi:hypothetical protein